MDPPTPPLPGRRLTPITIPTLEPRGLRLRRDMARLLVCDAGLHTVLESSDGDPLHLGPRRTSITAAQRRAVHARHRHCTWPGCAALVVQLHHRHHRVAGGHDDIENLVPLCSHHHGVVHRRAIVIGHTDHGELDFVRADGSHITSGSPFARPLPRASDTSNHATIGATNGATTSPTGPGATIAALRERQRSLGIDTEAPLRSPQWRNDHFDLGACIEAVQSRRAAALRRTVPTGST